jgi:ribose 5-phosphate isomerase B
MIFIGADHGGFAYKERLIEWLRGLGYQVEDCGAPELDPGDDYPEYAFEVAGKVAAAGESGADEELGILICRSSGGVTIAANKIQGIRAATATDARMAQKVREDDHANILTLAADWLDWPQVQEITLAFLNAAPSQAERHLRRIQKISSYEDSRN